MNDLPLRILGRLEIFGEADLAGATTVDGAADEAQRLRLPNDDIVGGTLKSVDSRALLAREVAAVSDQG